MHRHFLSQVWKVQAEVLPNPSMKIPSIRSSAASWICRYFLTQVWNIRNKLLDLVRKTPRKQFLSDYTKNAYQRNHQFPCVKDETTDCQHEAQCSLQSHDLLNSNHSETITPLLLFASRNLQLSKTLWMQPGRGCSCINNQELATKKTICHSESYSSSSSITFVPRLTKPSGGTSATVT
jgi:hypothetical protein